MDGGRRRGSGRRGGDRGRHEMTIWDRRRRPADDDEDGGDITSGYEEYTKVPFQDLYVRLLLVHTYLLFASLLCF